MEFDFSKKPGRRVLNRGRVIVEKPLVSVITPYYNAGKYFKELYNCVLNQTFPWFEWIIVDDGSSNQEDLVCLNKLCQEDTRIRIIHKTNSGPASARNCGIKESKTDIIITLDADDLIETTFFEELYWALYFNPNAAWAYTDSVGFQNKEYVWKHSWDTEELTHANYLIVSAAIRKKSLLEAGGYDETEKHSFEDWRLWLQLLSRSQFPVHVTSIEYWYRQTATGVFSKVTTNSTTNKKAIELVKEVADKVDKTVQAKIFREIEQEDKFALPQKSKLTLKYYSGNNNKIKILFIIPWMVTGGADKFNLDFVRLIDKTKYEVIIITTEKSDNPWKQNFREYVTEIYSLPDFLDIRNYAEFISYIIETRKIDVYLISNSYYGYYILPWLKSVYPSLAVIDYVHMEEMYWRAGGFARTSMAMSDMIEKTYVCNNATRQTFVNRFKRKENEIETIHIGVDYNEFDPDKIEYGTIKSKYHIPAHGKLVLFPCRLHAQKRPYLMIEIAKETIKTNPNIYFLVVGDGNELCGMQQKTAEYRIEKNVIFAGIQTDMKPFYRDSDVTLICSLQEGLSLTAYESCSMMTPVITSDVGGQGDLIDNEVGVILPMCQEESKIGIRQYSKAEIKQYVDAIVSMVSEENKSEYFDMCRRCRRRIINGFGLDSMIQKMEEAINQCFCETRVSKRRMIAECLKSLPHLAADTSSMFITYEGECQNNNRIWNEVLGLRQEKERLNRDISDLQKIFYDMSHSVSFKIGRRITFIPRKLRGGVRCIKDHGIIYTAFYTMRKLIKG